MGGYWNNHPATLDAIEDGWMKSGDIGAFDKDRFLFILDRKKEVIISGGENIYPREVEEALYAHPAVAEVAVIGVPDNRWGEAVKAFVVRCAGTAVGGRRSDRALPQTTSQATRSRKASNSSARCRACPTRRSTRSCCGRRIGMAARDRSISRRRLPFGLTPPSCRGPSRPGSRSRDRSGSGWQRFRTCWRPA